MSALGLETGTAKPLYSGGEGTPRKMPLGSILLSPAREPLMPSNALMVVQRILVPLTLSLLTPPQKMSRGASLPSGSSTLLAAVVGGATGISARFRMGGGDNEVRRC